MFFWINREVPVFVYPPSSEKECESATTRKERKQETTKPESTKKCGCPADECGGNLCDFNCSYVEIAETASALWNSIAAITTPQFAFHLKSALVFMLNIYTKVSLALKNILGAKLYVLGTFVPDQFECVFSSWFLPKMQHFKCRSFALWETENLFSRVLLRIAKVST